MNDQKITVRLEKRETIGKGLGKLRRSGKLPAVIHMSNQESVPVSGTYAELYKIFQTAGKHHPVDVQVDDRRLLTIIKDVHFEPKKNKIQHIVFDQIKQNEKVETEVPLVIAAGSPAERAGLLVLTQIDTVEIAALPRDLPNQIEVSVDSLVEIGDKIFVSDLSAPTGVEILTDPEQIIAAVEGAVAPEQEVESADEEVVETSEVPSSES